MIESHTRKVKPFYWALIIITADHFSIGDLITQTIGWLIRINGEVGWRSLPLCFGLGPLLFIGLFRFLLLRMIVSFFDFSWLVLPLFPVVSLVSWQVSNSSTWLSTCLLLFSTTSTIWLTIWIFSSPSS
uniref:Uncharacterized protein n=1 Tax=Podarcis muralis TaxID=64176 RepID=A0A670JEB9_PODMU